MKKLIYFPNYKIILKDKYRYEPSLIKLINQINENRENQKNLINSMFNSLKKIKPINEYRTKNEKNILKTFFLFYYIDIERFKKIIRKNNTRLQIDKNVNKPILNKLLKKVFKIETQKIKTYNQLKKDKINKKAIVLLKK